MINFTFIIPHKNTPDLLRKCIDSIPHRDDVQIIVVDDNSDADKVDFEHFPGLNEPCTEVYLTKEGKGAGYARNVGLSHAVGKWVVFADADDFFHTEELEKAMIQYENTDVEVIFFKGDAIKIPSGRYSKRSEFNNKAVDIAIWQNDFSDVLLISSPCGKFFKNSFLQNYKIKFNEVKWSNDVVFMGKVARNVNNISASHICLYCITESNASLTTNTSIECEICRFIEDCKNMMLLKHKFGDKGELFYWPFWHWMRIRKRSKLKAYIYLPYAMYTGGLGFVRQMYKAIVK